MLLSLELPHQLDCAFALGLVLQRIVVVVKLRVGVGLVRILESLLNKVVADNLVPLRLAHGAVFVQRFIDNVPSVDPPFVPSNHRTDVIMHAFEQSIAGEWLAVSIPKTQRGT